MASTPRAQAALLRQQESLRAVIESISAELELAPLLGRILGHACDLLGAEYGAIGLADEDGRSMEIAAMQGLPPGELGRRYGVGEGLAGHVLEVRRPVLFDRYDRLPRPGWAEVADHAVVAVPLQWRGRLLGFFGVGSPPPRRFGPEDVEALTLFGRHAAIAIENARLYALERRRSERLALLARVGQIITSDLELHELLDRAADTIHELLGYPNVDIPLLDPNGRELVIRARGGRIKELISREDRIPIAQGIMGAAVRERRAQLVNDVAADPRYILPPGTAGSRAELAVPILLGEQALGVLNVEADHAFNEDDLQSLQTVADHLAVAIRNARLFERAQAAATLEERQRLSRDLHDSLTQLLFSITLMAESVRPAWRQDPAEGEQRLERLMELSRRALAEMRALLADLRGEEGVADLEGVMPGLTRVRREGLPGALRRYAGEISADALSVGFDFQGYRPQPFDREEALYRIAQEALTNVVKHAGANRVQVVLALDAEAVHLTVTDDGRGFEPGELLLRAAARGAGREGGLGFVSMRERAEALHGALRIVASPGGGTRVEVTLPAAREQP
ncbi:MAG TPA: GAF domain-containing protein [Vicinamibacteria bacterium]